MTKISNSTQILMAMVLGIVAGFFLGEKGAMFAPLGDIFILLIKMVIIPENPFASLVSGNILQILFFALFFGIALSVIPDEKRQPLIDLIETINQAMIWMIKKVLIIAPIGVFGLMVNSIALFGMDIMKLVLALLAVFSGTLALIHFGMMPLLVMLLGRMNPIKFLAGMKETQILAFASASSMATLPVNKQECEALGVKPAVTAFVLPLGATINMNGNAMLYALTATFFAQMFEVELGMGQYVAIILTSVLGAIGTAGVPGPALLVVAVLVAAGIPLAGLPLIFGVDRLFDMMRTSTNVLGDASCAVIVNRMLEGDSIKTS